MTLISIGPTTPILQNVVYAIPSIPVEISSGAVVQSSIFPTGPFTNVANGLINGCFIKCVTGDTTVTLTKHLYGAAEVEPPEPFNGLVSTANLVSYWKLDEASGNRLDSHGTNHLTPTNSPISAAGKISNGCDFESGSLQYLNIPSNASLQLGDSDFTFAVWIKCESLLSHIIISKDSASGREFTLVAASDNKITFGIPGLLAIVSIDNITTGTWIFIVAWHDATADTYNLQLNNGAVASVSSAISIPVTTTPFHIGSRAYTGFEDYFDGLIDEVSLWRRVLTPAERTALYNSGNGLTY